MAFILPPAIVAGLASTLDVEPAAIRAFAEVEAGDRGPFYDDGVPLCLFERHIFRRLTAGRFDASAPDLSARTPGGYGLSRYQPGRVLRASLLSREAAFRAASWGLWQILGDNAERIGYPRSEGVSPAEALASGCLTIEGQALGLRRFVAADERLLLAIRERNWPRVARIYNGTAYRNHAAGPYDERLAAAYVKTKGRE